MENSKQRLHQKSLWQAANLLSQLPRVYTPCLSPPKLPCPLTSFYHESVTWNRGLTVHLSPYLTNGDTEAVGGAWFPSALVIGKPGIQVSCLPSLDF